MTYRKLGDGSYAVGFVADRHFIAYASAYDAREARALVAAIRALLDLFHKTSGAWVTMSPGGVELRRGATAKTLRAAARRGKARP
jgi:hypothetical protein